MRIKIWIMVFFLFFAPRTLLLSESPIKEEKIFKIQKGSNAKIRRQIIQRIALPKLHHEGIFIEGDRVLINNGEGKNTQVLDLDSGIVTKEIKPVGEFSESITRAPDGKYWHTDWKSKKLYLIRIEDDQMVPEYSISLEPSHPAGCVWTGECLYVITWTRGLGTKYHLLKMDQNGNVLDKIRIAGINEPSQVLWDGRSFWISSWFERRVYRVMPETYRVRGYFSSPVKKTTGIAWDGKYFWLTGTKADLYKIEVAPD